MGIPNEIARRELSLDENNAETSIEKKYAELRSVIVNNFDSRVWFLTDACLSTIASLGLSDQQNPVGLNIVGPASSEKTTVLSFFYGNDDLVYHSDNFTPASFVSHSAKTKRDKLHDVDMLPKIRGKCLVVPELAPIFGTNKDELLHNFSILTRVFDGEGLQTNSGVHGRRGYEGDYYFAWLGATTPIRKAVWNTMAQLGSRLLFLAAPSGLSVEDKSRKMFSEFFERQPYRDRVEICRSAVREFLGFLMAQYDNGGELPHRFYRAVAWKKQNEPPEIIRTILNLSVFTVKARQAITIWTEDSGGQPEANYSQPIPEEPDRLFSVLYGLARGHAIVNGRDRLSEDDLPLIVEVALSTMPDDRRDLVDALLMLDHPEKTSVPGELTSTELTTIKTISKPKALRLFETLEVLGLCSISRSEGPDASRVCLRREFSWLLARDFQKYRRIWIGGLESSPGLPF